MSKTNALISEESVMPVQAIFQEVGFQARLKDLRETEHYAQRKAAQLVQQANAQAKTHALEMQRHAMKAYLPLLRIHDKPALSLLPLDPKGWKDASLQGAKPWQEDRDKGIALGRSLLGPIDRIMFIGGQTTYKYPPEVAKRPYETFKFQIFDTSSYQGYLILPEEKVREALTATRLSQPMHEPENYLSGIDGNVPFIREFAQPTREYIPQKGRTPGFYKTMPGRWGVLFPEVYLDKKGRPFREEWVWLPETQDEAIAIALELALQAPTTLPAKRIRYQFPAGRVRRVRGASWAGTFMTNLTGCYL